jgi:micrococcal nuclease
VPDVTPFIPPATILPTQTQTVGQFPTISPTDTLAPSKAPTTALPPSITATATEDLSFYSLADCIPQNTSYQRATVTNVIDGDTVEVLIQDGTSATVRYIGIDAPENDFPFFGEARQANFDLVSQREVVLVKDRSEVDQYERLLRYVIAEDVFVNVQLVESGYARAVDYPPDSACAETFASAERQAREALAGMWVTTPTAEPTAPRVIILTVDKRQEWVDIQNVGNSDVDLTGWNLVSERGNQECPLSGVIRVGETLRIWAMAAQGPGFSCGYNKTIWNNSEPDPAVLYNAEGVEVDRK